MFFLKYYTILKLFSKIKNMENLGKKISNDSPKLEQLFGSKTRVRLMMIFLHNENSSYYVRELTRLLRVQINSVRRELENLRRIGIINVVQEGDRRIEKQTGIKEKKYYSLNSSFALVNELKNLFIRSKRVDEQDFVKKLAAIEGLEYLALTGIFTKSINENMRTDILAVGNVNKDEFSTVVKKIEQFLNREIYYTIFSREEFKYRQDVSDKFLYDILSNKKIVLVDKVN